MSERAPLFLRRGGGVFRFIDAPFETPFETPNETFFETSVKHRAKTPVSMRAAWSSKLQHCRRGTDALSTHADKLDLELRTLEFQRSARREGQAE
jgi:hypothetical protein